MVDVIGSESIEDVMPDCYLFHNRPKSCPDCGSKLIEWYVKSDEHPENMQNGPAIVERLITYSIRCLHCNYDGWSTHYKNKYIS